MRKGYSYNKLYPRQKRFGIMASISRKRRGAPSQKAKKYILLLVFVFSIILINKHSTKNTPEDKALKEDTLASSNSANEDSSEESSTVIDAIESVNKFEEKFEKEEEEREHLDKKIVEVKEEIDQTEATIVEGKEEELSEMMESKRDQLTREIKDYLKSKEEDMDVNKVASIVDRLKERIDEEVKKDLRIQAEAITIAKEDAVDEMALEDVVNGMENKDIEKDVVAYEKNLLEDLKTEIDEVVAEIENTVDFTIDEIKTKVVREIEEEEKEESEKEESEKEESEKDEEDSEENIEAQEESEVVEVDEGIQEDVSDEDSTEDAE